MSGVIRFVKFLIIPLIFFASVVTLSFIFFFDNQSQHISSELYLPPPEFGSKSMNQALIEKYSWNHSFNSNDIPISIQDLSNILWAAQGENRPGARVTPSAGATYPLEIYILSTIDIGGIYPMIAKYSPNNHKLLPISRINRSEDLFNFLPTEFHNLSSHIWIIGSSIESRTSARYGSRAPQYITLEIGHVLENIRLTAWGRELKIKTLIELQNTLDWELILEKESKLEFFIGLAKYSMREINKENRISSKILENLFLNLSIEETINLRSSRRDYLNENITNVTINSFFKLFCGLLGNGTQSNYPHFSGESLLNYFVFIGDQITGFNSGIYNLSINNGSLFVLGTKNKILDLQTAGLDQQWIGLASLDIVIASKAKMTSTSRLAVLEAGVAGQRIYHVCTLIGLGTVVVGAFYDNLVQNIVQSNGWPLYIIPVGPVKRSLISPEIDSIPLTLRTIGNLAGILAVLLIILMALIHTKVIRQLLKIKRQRIHYTFAGVIIGLILVHITLLNGYFQIRSGDLALIIDFLINLILFPPLSLELPESIGLWFSRIAVWSLLLLIFFMLPIRVINNRFSVKVRYYVHLCLFIFVIFFVLIHSFLNSNLLNLYFDYYLIIVIILASIWVFIHQYASVVKKN